MECFRSFRVRGLIQAINDYAKLQLAISYQGLIGLERGSFFKQEIKGLGQFGVQISRKVVPEVFVRELSHL